jgi:hypothetical protein
MADALAAFGLASNIVQFVDAGIKLVSYGRELYCSEEGASKENTVIDKIAADIKLITQNLANGVVNNDPALQEMVGKCAELAGDLHALLQVLKIDTQKNRRMETMKKSLKSFRKRHEIKDIYDRLCKVRDQVCFHLNYLLMYVPFSSRGVLPDSAYQQSADCSFTNYARLLRHQNNRFRDAGQAGQNVVRDTKYHEREAMGGRQQ